MTNSFPSSRLTRITGASTSPWSAAGAGEAGACAPPRRAWRVPGHFQPPALSERPRAALAPKAALPLEVDQFLQHLVRGRDHPRVGLEAPLRHDHVGELLRQVHVDISRAPELMDPRIPVPAAPITAWPELLETLNRVSPVLIRPAGLAKVARAICPSWRSRPLENEPTITPFASMPKLFSTPAP